MNLKKKALALAIASAVAAPNAFAVQGSDGMHYTSAAEGLYASIRAQFHSGNTDKDKSSIGNSGSRFGIQGTGEMSHGLEGFYRYEAAVGIGNGTDVTTRMGHVGLRGGFGSAAFGTMWSNEYNWVYGATDLPNAGGGNFATYGGGVSDSSQIAGFRGRTSTSMQYTSPNFNGLQVGLRFDVNGGTDEGAPEAPMMRSDATFNVQTAGADTADDTSDDTYVSGVPGQENDLDQWALSAKYDFGGFTVAGTYTHAPDWMVVSEYDATMKTGSMDTTEDLTAWAVRGGYGQDNWGVNVWYGQNSISDFGAALDDSTAFSISGNVSVGKTGIVVMHESLEYGNGIEDTYSVIDVQYQLNSKAKVWIGYVARDLDSDPATEDYFNLGVRHDF